ncbi:MAG TPA: carboxypeptidase regulatory-like domain-containing protein, partial [Vicinamibacterales bacterium]|nr:carboxypeptidase regulatory-like domain-containing protein [Vicinamibacterales bacterium]
MTKTIVCVVAVLLAPGGVVAQTNVGQISGVVRDPSGGVLPGVAITIVNVDTQFIRTETTDEHGAYVVTNLPVGDYSVTAELEGFRKATRTDFAVTADGRLTADFTLNVGQMTETVLVRAVRGEQVNRTSGEIARVIDGDQVRDLALSGRNYIELATLIPGAVQLEDDPMVLTTSLSASGAAINGARGNSGNLTVDGGFNLDSGSNASQISNVGLEFIDQVKIQTSNFSAEYGRNSGPAINVVTRSGTNRLRGSVFETYRDESLDAAEFFAPRDDNGRPIKGQLHFNDYGSSLGGPIRRNKVFFFGGLELKSLDRVDGPTRRTLPSLAELGGDFSARLAGADGTIGTADDSSVTDQLIDPDTGEAFPGGIIPQSRITPDGRAIARIYQAMIERALKYTNSPTGNNATFQLDFPFDWYQTFLRLDYRFNDRQSVYLRYLHDRYDLHEPRGTFINSQLPTIPTRRLRPGDSYQI